MNNIILTVIILAIMLVLITLYFKFYKGDKINKILIFLVGITVVGTVVFLVCFPSGKWKDKDYFIGIAQMLGGLFTVIGVYFTIKEEEKIRKIDELNAENKLKEQLRLENLPVLKFKCNNDVISNSGNVYYVDCTDENDETCRAQLNLEIKNVGLGSAQNIWFQKIIGIENDNSRSGIENQIIEPKETINNTMYFVMPKNKVDLYKRLTILVFYDDLLGNQYMQKLDGSISFSCCESNGNIEYNPNVFVAVNAKYEKIGNNYKYEIPQEIIEEELDRIKYEEENKDIYERIPDKDKIDELIVDYLKGQINFSDLLVKNLKSLKFSGGGGGISNYNFIKRNIYDVTIFDEACINRKECIKCETKLRINIKTEEIKCISKQIVKCTLKIKKRELNKLNKEINRELKRIKQFELEM